MLLSILETNCIENVLIANLEAMVIIASYQEINRSSNFNTV